MVTSSCSSSFARIGCSIMGILSLSYLLARRCQLHFWSSKSRNSTCIYRRCPVANIGDHRRTVETPCLVVDMDVMEMNMKKLKELMQPFPNVATRPHAKAHKSAKLAQMQQKLCGAIGVCCQKVAEAEAMIDIGDILLSNEIVGTSRYKRMAKVAKEAIVTLVFDSDDMIRMASGIAVEENVTFGALVDVNVGQNRCGVDTKEEALMLASTIDSMPGLEFKGVQAYHGAAQHIRDYQEKTNVITAVAKKAQNVVSFLRKHGFTCEIVTGGGTGTFLIEAASGVFTEVQPGSFMFYDVDYSKNLNQGNTPNLWNCSLFVLSTIMSRNENGNFAVVDAGLKAVSLDSGVPIVKDNENIIFENAGDEHGKLLYPATEKPGSLGQQIYLIPGHCDPTVNMHDFIIGIRKDIVENIWTVDARGPGN